MITWNEPIKPPRYNFRELIEKYPDLEGLPDDIGRYDFSNQDAIRRLAETILSEYHGILCVLSASNLCPRVPNRLLYLQWIEKVLEVMSSTNEAEIIDIGTGSSLIYPLLGCWLNRNWTFIGTECDEKSYQLALDNLARNPEYQSRISLRKTDKNAALLPQDLGLTNSGTPKDVVIMCNPPFFDIEQKNSEEFLSKIDLTKLVATDLELFYPGGEVGFVSRLIGESTLLKQVKWFTSMIGQFSSIEPIVHKLREENISNFGLFELDPTHESRERGLNLGKPITRWIIAWSFQLIHLPDFLGHQYNKKYKGLNGLWTTNKFEITKDTFLLQSISESSLKLLDSAVVTSSKVSVYKADESDLIEITVDGDVWSRSYRRKLRKLQESSTGEDEPSGKKRKTVPMFPETDKTTLQILYNLSRKQVTVFWKSGTNEKIFESFTGYLKREIEKGAKL